MKEGVSQGVFMEKLSGVVLESKLHIFPLARSEGIGLDFKGGWGFSCLFLRPPLELKRFGNFSVKGGGGS